MSYLVHHGILGMRWGIRRYQNKDGSYTKEGQRRYGIREDMKKSIEADYKYAQESAKKAAAIASDLSKNGKDALRRLYEETVDDEELMTEIFEKLDEKQVRELVVQEAESWANSAYAWTFGQEYCRKSLEVIDSIDLDKFSNDAQLKKEIDNLIDEISFEIKWPD